MLKRLFYASASLLMLALAYHLGAMTTQVQAADRSTGTLDKVVTRELVVVDEQGATRASLRTMNGGTWFMMSDKDGEPLLSMMAQRGHTASIMMYDDDGALQMILSTDFRGPDLSLIDGTGQPRVTMGVDVDNTPHIALLGPKGGQVWQAGN